RARMAQQSGIISNISSKVFGSENKILFMLDREDEETADTELIEVVPCDAKDLLKCKENELPEKFRQLFDFISASGNNT
ncbi:MAG: hypothetical protein MK193_06390, partial [Lentisphaeria bacterium]|nr:hypothetical protein [Lentisphaeria bacterium]